MEGGGGEVVRFGELQFPYLDKLRKFQSFFFPLRCGSVCARIVSME